MSHGNQSYLRFSLEESVWFQKGQEVDELISISLDPNITIQESDQYITIKGSLELSGEYNREDIHVEKDEEDDFFNNPKTIQVVEVREEGLHTFLHQFPVEVTIPKNRIQNLDDIDVTVETFDYAFPEKSCLRLNADLMILGLYGEQQHELYEQEEEAIDGYQQDFDQSQEDVSPFEMPELPQIEINEVYDPPSGEMEGKIPEAVSRGESPASTPKLDDEVYEPFEVEARKDPLEKEKIEKAEKTPTFEEKYPDIALVQNEEKRKEIPIAKDEPNLKEEPNHAKNILHEEPNQAKPALQEEPDQALPNFQEESNQAIPIFREEPNQEEPIIQEAQIRGEKEQVEAEVVPEITFTPKQIEKVEKEDADSILEEQLDEEEEVIEEESSSPQLKKKSKKLKNKQSITLSEFFARKDDEEHTKVKMCIVQTGDTLDTLSERYEVPVSQIQRVNRMELNQDIFEGQVLYIPEPQEQR